jgi:hypothetical protein
MALRKDSIAQLFERLKTAEMDLNNLTYKPMTSFVLEPQPQLDQMFDEWKASATDPTVAEAPNEAVPVSAPEPEKGIDEIFDGWSKESEEIESMFTQWTSGDGAAVQTSLKARETCPSCNYRAPSEAKFCPKCGEQCRTALRSAMLTLRRKEI